MDQRIINLYDEYTHKPLPRQEFLKKLALLTGSTMAAMAILPMLENNYAQAQTVAQGDDLETGYIEYAVEGGKMKAYMAKPKKQGKLPAVIVIHENRGLNAHIEDVARRAASAGYLAIAPDALSPLGGTPQNSDDARGMFQQLDRAKTVDSFVAGVAYLRGRKDCSGKVGCVGFCWGGAMANSMAVGAPDLKAAVAFYGSQPKAEEVANIKAAVQLHYAGLDERINAGIPAYEAALKANKVVYEIYTYDNVNHAFHNDTAGARYNADAAKLAWERTLAFFKKHLG